MVGATTLEEYRKHIEKDAALARRFQSVFTPEPTVEDTISILRGLKEKYEAHHGVRITDGAIVSAATLSNRYITDRFLPDKAIDMIDEAGANQRLLAVEDRKKTISEIEIENIVSKMARIPPKQVSRDDKSLLKNLERNLKLAVFGQDKAIDALSSAIKLSRSGLGSEDQPIGSFLFTGPTGVGKTEVTKQLAHALNIELVRFDMSEYMERHTVSRLIGAPPGYVGFDQGGLLTDSILQQPHCVLLLDEIEKAHPDVFNLLLQVMDHGTLTDNNGRKADFRNVIIVMTSNAGASEIARNIIGFGSGMSNDQSHQGANSDKAIKSAFSPEFRNRLDGIIQFSHLDVATITVVVDKFLSELEAQLVAKDVTIEVTETAKTWLAQKGYDKTMGARPMARVIQEHIKRPLADNLLFGDLVKGGEVVIDAESTVSETLKISIVGAKPKRKTANKKVKTTGVDQ
jgi:ATP-dependent Clp protease ATP-binding subunit ClpA